MASTISSLNSAMDNLDLLVNQQQTFQNLSLLNIDESSLKIDASRNLRKAVTLVALGALAVLAISLSTSTVAIIASTVIVGASFLGSVLFIKRCFNAKQEINNKENVIKEICQIYKSIALFFKEE